MVVILVLVVVLIKKSTNKKSDEAKAAPVLQATAPAAPKLRFQGVSGVFEGKRFSVNGRVSFGRNPMQNDVVYPEGTQGISGVHCALTNQDGRLYLQDLGSTYGTFLGNGQRLVPNQPVELHAGDSFYLGSEKEKFTIVPQRSIMSAIARILEDARYTGEQGFPQIIPDVSFVSHTGEAKLTIFSDSTD